MLCATLSRAARACHFLPCQFVTATPGASRCLCFLCMARTILQSDVPGWYVSYRIRLHTGLRTHLLKLRVTMTGIALETLGNVENAPEVSKLARETLDRLELG
jgi:hypothetical protein